MGLNERLMSSKKPLKNTSDSPKKNKRPFKRHFKRFKITSQRKRKKDPKPSGSWGSCMMKALYFISVIHKERGFFRPQNNQRANEETG
ncbi:hypothetical protein HpHN84_05000 [Helicobacter pylori]